MGKNDIIVVILKRKEIFPMSMLAQFRFDDQEIRFYEGSPIAIDIARALNYVDPKSAVKKLIDKDYLTVVKMPTIRYGENKPRLQRISAITNEAGIYQLILNSKTSKAKQFQKWLFEEVLPSIRKTGKYELITEPPKEAIQWYSERIKKLPECLEIDKDYWTVIEQCGYLLLEIERLGYPINKFDLLDGSIGRRWSSERKRRGLTGKTKLLNYQMEDRKQVKIQAYSYDELGIFSHWLKNVYMTQIMPEYLEGKYGKLATIS